jgi:predicted amidohydrolase
MMKMLFQLIILILVGGFAMAQNNLRIAGLQMDVSNNIAENEQTIMRYLNDLKNQDVDFLITPEGSLSGYSSQFDSYELRKSLEKIEETAKDLNIGLILGTCYKASVSGKEYCYNQARVYLPDGTFLGAYSKILTCSPLENPGTGEMMEYVQGSVKTFTVKDIEFGILICNDLWATPGYTTIPNPYLPWKMQEAGAKVIFHIINSGTNLGYKNFHEASVELWAKTLNIPIIEINAAHGDKEINAGSGIINGKGERVRTVKNKGEQLFIYDLAIK